ncbi:T9SS type A sorting domain-containing protein [Psychroserpens burtonensis]|uniref:T9SS type A sorting domain-containing protein n=1 Tax=Psychroserpens burtonensis TaxID=49278 RepID=A0A5C7BA31_9FLAO|nr:T9SS type A sorting domain-containing protein [Psychroserpens burtonensis]TXE19640.1 T9SS type A sorting domain-containing protein [Psychroserpens burtonensis]
MKKITFVLVLVLFAFSANAQPFPAPYCDITDANDVTVEEITSIDFAGTSIINTDTNSVLVDKTTTTIFVVPESIYTLQIKGNTYGDFNTDIVAFIDWNQNDLLDDVGEIYSVGTLTNTDGNDGMFVSLDITVPSDALIGITRVRMTKTYQDADSPAEISPCGIQFNPFGQGLFAGYGQALDLSIDVGTLSVLSFDDTSLSVYPTPVKDILNITYKSTLDRVEVYNLLGQNIYKQQIATPNLELNMSSFTSGLYIVNIYAGDTQHSFRVVKD